MALRKPMPDGVDRHVLTERIRAKVEEGPDCWPWIGSSNPKGYGVISIRQVTHLVARIVWWLETGDWPGDWCVLHRCDNPACCRPDHLFLGTHADNMADMSAKGRANGIIGSAANVARQRAATHCKWGHEFTPENTRVDLRGFRVCRSCGRARNRERRARKSGRHHLRPVSVTSDSMMPIAF